MVLIMKKIYTLFPVLIFLLLLYSITLINIFGEKHTYSAEEKRMLQTIPKVTKKRILNGKFQKKYEIYLSDQFPARSQWIQLKSGTERLLGKTESNGVYFGKDDYLLEKYEKDDFDKKQIKKNIKVLQSFAETMQKTAQVHIMLVPSKTAVLHDLLPLFATSYDENKLYQKVEEALSPELLIDIRKMLQEHSTEEIYYRTDHHWTTLGAFYGYDAYRRACGYETQQKQKELKEESSSFLGSTYAKINYAKTPDHIDLYYPHGTFQIIYNMGEKTEDTFYQKKYLENNDDQYSVFSGGNQALLEISGGEKNGKTLFLVKDSFANCIIPYLMEDYEKIIVVDMRQINVSLSRLAAMYAPTDVLVLYNIVQFMQDTHLAMKP